MLRTPRVAAAAPAAAALALAAAPAPAQQAGPERDCALTLEPTDSTQSVSRQVAEDAYVTHIRNGMRWLCGPATMTADSAVQYETRGEVEMIGSVHYRDTVRDLRSRRLTYFQPESRVLAEDSVRLRQLATGSLLRGPRVEFYNAVVDEGPQRTVATRRPRMRIPSPGDTAGEPFRVVADTAVFVGEEEAEAFGGVVIRRRSLTARAGHSRFGMRDGSGLLTRSPSVRGEGYVLTGDTIRVAFSGGELRTVRARGDGHLESEDVEVRARSVVVRIRDETADELWAFGEGGGRAYSARQEIRGDSLHFDLEGGRLRGIAASGRAVAMQILPGESPAEEPGLYAPPTDSAGPPSAAPPGGEEAGPARDSTAPATPTAPGRDTVAGDSASAGGDRAEGPARPGSAPAPGLDRNWILGDTVRATFAAAVPDSAAGPADSLPARDSASGEPAEPDAEAGDTAAADSAAPARDTAATDLERLVAIGDARSFYRIRRDSGETGAAPRPSPEAAPDTVDAPVEDRRMARNYVIGDRITIRFRAGEPLSVGATRAIGLFLEPAEDAGGAPADSPAARDTTAEDTTARDAAGTGGNGDAPEGAAGAGSPRVSRALPRRSEAPGPARVTPLRVRRVGTLPSEPGIRRTGGMVYE